MAARWIADNFGTYALVDGAEQRALWTLTRGWHHADKPGPNDQVRVVNGDMFGCIPFGALAAGWAEKGWKPGPPPEPVDVHRDPAPVVEEQPPPVEQSTPQTKAAAGGQSKEK